MAAAGYVVPVRGDSITALLASPEPTKDEVTQALADYDCQAASGLREARRAWLAAQTSQWLATNKTWIDSLLSSRAAHEAKLTELEQTGWHG
jgi:hypothetical protein